MWRQATTTDMKIMLPATTKPSRFLLYVVPLLTLLPVILLAALYYIAQVNATPMTQRFLKEFFENSGYACTVEQVDIVPLPLPSIAFRGLTVEGDGLSFSADSIVVRPDYLALLHGVLEPRAVSGTVRALPWLEQLNFAAKLTHKDDIWAITSALQGNFRKDETLLPFSVSGNAFTQNQHTQIRLENLNLSFGSDSGQLNAVLTLKGGEDQVQNPPNLPSLQGRMQLHHLSLTRWFGFARNLTPGIQLSLDNITDGTLDFTLDMQGLTVPHITAHAAGGSFTGSGGVESWTKPTVALKLIADRLRLETGIPEAAGTLPTPPVYPHEPLTALPGLSPHTDGLDISYDIRLGAQILDYGPLLFNDALVVIGPGKVDKNGFEEGLLIADATLYGGSVHGAAILGGGRDITYAITLRLRDVEGASLVKALPIIPVNGTRFQADADITSRGREIAVFLDKLNGSASIKAAKGTVSTPADTSGGKNSAQTSFAFNSLEAKLNIRSGVWANERLGLNGQWQATLNSTGMNMHAGLNGMLYFGGEGVNKGTLDFQNLAGSVTLQLSPDRSKLPEGIQASMTGNFSSHKERKQISVANANFNALDINGQGDIQISQDKSGIAWQGKILAKFQDIGHTLRLAHIASANMPAHLRTMTLETAFKGNADELALDTIRARFEHMTISGNLHLSLQQQTRLDFDLEADHLNFDLFRDVKKKKPAPPPPSVPWDLRFMRAINAHGELRAAKLTAWKLEMQAVKIPVVLESGRFTCAPLSASLYGAAVKGKAGGEFTRGLRFDTSLSTENFDLFSASNHRGDKSVLGGQTDVSANLHAVLTGSNQLPAALNGNVRFSVQNGSYQKRDEGGALKGKPTLYKNATGSGVITSGVLRGNDFILKGDGLSIKGGGWVDLPKDTLDCNYIVSMRALPDIPVHIYGSLENTKTSVNAPKVVLNALGDLTLGVTDVLGNIVQGAFHLFTK